MPTTTTGVIEELEKRETKSGDGYVMARVAGHKDGLFDWKGLTADAGVQVGDRVAIEHGQGQYPRITAVKKISTGSGKQGDLEQVTPKPNGRDVYIARMCAVKASACLLQDSRLEYQQRTNEVLGLAERLEQWILRQAQGSG